MNPHPKTVGEREAVYEAVVNLVRVRLEKVRSVSNQAIRLDKHHRRSIRLPGHDYRQPGAYFVTIVTQGRTSLLGEVVEGDMRMNDAGQMVRTVWEEIPIHYPGVLVDAFVVMPNHIHDIIILVGAGPCACPETGIGQPQDTGQPQGVAPTWHLDSENPNRIGSEDEFPF